MKLQSLLIILSPILISCKHKTEPTESLRIEGTWKLISGTTIQKGDTTFTDYTKGNSMIKIINKSHFAFLNHDSNKGKDSTALFGAGGGRYELKGDQYTEHLEYCSDRVWEANTFSFTVSIKNDTLSQMGREKVEGTDVDRVNVERYVRVGY